VYWRVSNVFMEYDLLVIGSGSAAFAAGIEARSLGASVVLIESSTIGGTCVNVGCVPSKTLLAAAGITAQSRHNNFKGLSTSSGPIDLGALVTQKDELVSHLRQSKYEDVAKTHGFEILKGRARFVDQDTVMVGESKILARSIILATGAEPAVPSIRGLDSIEYLTSTTAMELRTLPKRLVVIGAGFVGVEQAQLFSQLGSTVTLRGRLLPDAEPELTAILDQVLKDAGVGRCNSRVVSIERTNEGIVVHCEDGSVAVGDQVLVATGRRSRVHDLNVDGGGIALDERGRIKVDATLHTSNPKVWAAGDVVAGPQFVYVAATSGRVAAKNAITGSSEVVDMTGLPHVAFTTPQLAWSGITEEEAINSGLAVEVRTLSLGQVPRAIANRETRGAIKLVADAKTHRLLGVHVLADHGGELLFAATLAIKANLTIKELGSTWAPYLTMNEGFKLAAQSFSTNVAELSCCAS
jgi:mercuric reductase